MNQQASGRRTKLTSAVKKRIVDAIKQGAFDHVAAQAAGIAPATFREWMARGEGRDPDRPSTTAHAAFAAEVRKARAAARSNAEARVFRTRPFEWLRYGPGRDRPGEPGWTEPSDSAVDSAEAHRQGVPIQDPKALRKWLGSPEQVAAIGDKLDRAIGMGAQGSRA